jgi:hypothetical protein
MNIDQKLVSAFLKNETIKIATYLLDSIEQTRNVEFYNFGFLLTKTTANVVTFEFQIITRSSVNKITVFSQPIGYFAKNSNKDVVATILYEFEEEYNFLVGQNKITHTVKVEKLTLFKNAIIGAFSAECFINLQLIKDCTFSANGLEYYIVVADDGEPQVFLDRKYNLSRKFAFNIIGDISWSGDNCIAIYTPSNKTLYSNVIYAQDWNKLYSLGIFTINKFC